MKIVHHYSNGCFDGLISGQQSVNPSREVISILSRKYERFTFAHPVLHIMLTDSLWFIIGVDNH